MDAIDVAHRFGLRRYPRSWRGDCPNCGYAGTFSVRPDRNGRALLFCASCHDRGALVAIVARATGQDRKAIPLPEKNEAARRHHRQDRALALWQGSEPISGTPAQRYLTARGLADLTTSQALRFRGDTPHPEGGKCPALIALVSGSDGRPLAVHRTFLTRDGRKAAVVPGKASLGPVWGGAIRLHLIAASTPLIIAEGVETAGSAGRLLGLPAWAAISAGNLAKGLTLPPEARHVVIAADPDDAGRAAARDAWLRWRAEGRAVQIATPDGSGDFNDLVREAAANG